MSGVERRVERALRETGWKPAESEATKRVFALGTRHGPSGRVEVMFYCLHGYGSGFVHEHAYVQVVYDMPVRTKRQRDARAKALTRMLLGVVARHHARAGMTLDRFAAAEWSAVAHL